MDRLLFIDTETGGLDPQKHSLLSIALVVWEDCNIIDSLELLINDGVLLVTDEALAINKIIIEDHIKDALNPAIATEKLLLFIDKHFTGNNKITLAGHNVHFDVAFLKTFLSKNNKKFSNYFSHRIVDTSSILYYLFLSGVINQKAISSDKAFEHFEIHVQGRHTALGDAIATAELFTKLLSLTNK